MTHDTPPKRIWAWSEDHGDVCTNEWLPDGDPDVPFDLDARLHILASEAEAMVAATLREAAEGLLDWYTNVEDDRGPHMVVRALIPQPASAALDKLIAEAVNEAMLQCIGIVANLRNKRNPGPLFEVLNMAMCDIEDARLAAIREKNNG